MTSRSDDPVRLSNFVMILENAVAFNSRNSSDSPRSREKFPIRWTRNDVDDDDDGSPPPPR